MAERSTTERTIKTKLDGESTGALRRAAREEAREIERLRKVAERENAAMQASFDSGATNILRATSSITKGVLSVGSAVGSAQGFAGAAVALGAMSGSLLALPGLALSGGAAVGVLALATQGFMDAVKAEDLAEFTELTKDMAPAARDTAVAIRDQASRLTELKKIIQSEFFSSFAGDVRSLADIYFPLLNRETGQIAGGLNKMGRASLSALMAPGAVRDVNTVLDGTQDLLKELEPSIGNVLTGVLDLGAEGAEYTGRFGRAVNKVTEDFKEWVAAGVESGRINELIDEGIESTKTFGRVLGNLGSIGAAVWDGLSQGEEDFLDGIEETTQAVEDFFKSAEGQDVLRELAATLQTTADVARNVFSAALNQLGPLVREAAPAVRELVTAIGEFLVDAINTAGPLLSGLAGFLSDNKEAVGALVPVLLTLALGYKGLKVASEVKSWMSGLPGLFGDIGTKAGAAGDAIGDSKSGKGLAGKLGQLQALGATGFTLGALLTIDAATNQGLSDALNSLSGFPDAAERAKSGIGPDFWSQLFETPPAKPGDRNDIRNWVGESNFWQFEKDKIAKGRDSGIVLDITVDTFNAQLDLNKLINSVNTSSGTVNINGNDNPAGFALRRVLEEIAAGKETVTINGQSVPAQEALASIIEQINIGTGTVKLNGNNVPAGEALAEILRRIGGSTSNVNVGANTANAQGVIDGFITMNNGRTIQIYTSVNGSGGLASAGRLATGGRPFFDGRVTGPGTPTNDRAGLFALSRDEHVLNAAEVRAMGGHQAVYRLRSMALNGAFRGFADGGTPRYLSAPVMPVGGRSGGTAVRVEAPEVRVFIGSQEITDIVDTQIDYRDRQAERRASSGPGGAW